MSKIFDDREKQFENKYKHDEELRFKIVVRRNKLMGLWAATEMGLSAAAAETYAKDLVERTVSAPGDAALVQKIHADLAAKKVEMSERRIRTHLETCHAEAEKQVTKTGI
jgi:hypothetical protein